MRVVIQRVSEAFVSVDKQVIGKINSGLLVLAGFEESDTNVDIEWLSKKIIQLRIFNDSNGMMNLSIKDVNGEILTVSQFTLHALTKKGNRPSYIRAAKPETAIPLYEKFNLKLSEELGKPVQTGIFGAIMDVRLINDGPVTIIIDTKNKE
ncbi:MAG: D-aminoacyl-tRNA deacylase [Bacteroidota bacterium]